MEPPSSILSNSILDDYFSLGIALVVVLFVYALVSGINRSFNYLKDDFSDGSNKKGKQISYLLSNPESFYGTVLQFSLFVKLLIIFFSVRLLNSVVAAAALAIVLIYSVNEIVKLALKGREGSFFYNTSFVTLVMTAIATPFNGLLNRFTVVLEEEREEREVQSLEEITEAQEGLDIKDNQERTLLKNIVALNNTSVYDIMKPRVEVTALSTNMTAKEVMETAVKCGYSRLPVFDDNLDNIKGFLYIKDLVVYLKESKADYNWKQHIREAYFVPGNKKINDLLEEFRQKKIHLAMVADEYGGTDGIVTLEDVLEEIVGEISDESDKLQ
ncbi:MAG: CBS domain-containing protein [Bacteroidales bacterium]|nr:CBS domain-containing protein [Bacteroidales bacterium]